MYKKMVLLVSLLPLLCIGIYGQENYLVGSAAVSIEPDSSVFSLPLAGYGAPRDGRFSITWEAAGNIPGDIITFTGMDSKLYAVNKDHALIVYDVTQKNNTWTNLGKANDIISLCGYQKSLYAITSTGALLKRDINSKQSSWKKIGVADQLTALATANGKLYAAGNNAIWVRSLAANAHWKKTGDAPATAGLAAHLNRIYIVTPDNNLWMAKTYEPGGKWVKVGRYNNETVTIKFGQIAVANNHLYALSADNQLYVARHSSDGDLSARALAIRQGKQTAVIVGFDVCGFDYSLATAIKKEITKKRKIPAAAILLNCSHTHFAPVTQEFPAFGEHGQIPDSMYLNTIVKKGIIKAIESALDQMVPATVRFGKGHTNIGHNRSSPDNKTPYDSTVDVLYTTSANRNGNNILFLTACHPVFKNEGKEGYMVSANYPGVAKRLLEENNTLHHAIFLQGCAGDINPRDDDHRYTGKVLAGNVQQIISGNMQQITGAISYSLDTIQIPVHAWSKEKVQQFKKDNDNHVGNVGAEKNVRWANRMLDYYEKGTMPATMPVYCQTINIGNWKLVGLSREVVTAYSFAIKNLWPDKLVTVAGYTNEVPSYLPAASHIKRQTYEGYDSFFWNGQPGLFPENILDIVVDRIKAKNK